MAPLILATRNEHKLRELREALPGVEIEPLPEGVELPPETGETFAENALGKARAAHDATGRPAIADDSGIEAAALGGRPGCARPASRARRERRGEPEEAARGAQGGGRPRARLRLRDRAGRRWTGPRACSRAAARARSLPSRAGRAASATTRPSSPTTPGRATRRTMAELEPAEKHAISHRGRAAGSWRGRSGRRKGRERPGRHRARRDHQAGRRRGLDRLQRDPDRAQARRRRDHRLDRDPERGAPLDDRPDRLGDRLRRGPPRGRAGRPRAPLRAREGRERRRLDRGHADPGRRGGDHLRGRAPAGRRRGGRARSGSAWR